MEAKTKCDMCEGSGMLLVCGNEDLECSFHIEACDTCKRFDDDDAATLAAYKAAGGVIGAESAWDKILEHVRAHGFVYYQAPLDPKPVRCPAYVRGNGRRIRIKPLARDVDAFWADSGHEDRITLERGKAPNPGAAAESVVIGCRAGCSACGGCAECNIVAGCVACCRDCGRPCSFEKNAEGFHVDEVEA
jgi:hypothetical protein